MKKMQVCLGLLTAGLFAYLLFSSIHLKALSAALYSVRLQWLVMALLCLLSGYAVRAVRWWLMLRAVGSHAGPGVCIWPFVTSFGLNNVLPLRAGDAYRAFAFSERLDCSPWQILGTLAVERLLDLLTLLMIFFAAALAVPDPAVSRTLIILFQAVIGLGVAGTAVVVVLPGPLAQLFEKRQVRALAARTSLTEAIRRRALEVLQAMMALRGVHILLRLTYLSFVGWIFESLVFVCVAAALDAPDLSRGPLLGFSMGTLSTLLPGAPGYFGTFDYFATQGLRIAGTQAELAAANALLSHLIIWAPLTVMTIGYFLIHSAVWPRKPVKADHKVRAWGAK